MSNPITFSINRDRHASACRPDMTVLEWLREEALLRGTKEGCAEGDCGACSILLKRHGDKNFVPANACILLMGQVEGANIVTVEGLAALGPDGHAVQKHMAENGSSQCGFCTPGIVVSLAGLLERHPSPNEQEIHDALAGNLCRCTGYRPIVEAARSALVESGAGLTSADCADPQPQVGGADSILHSPTTLSALLDLKEKYPKAVLLAGGTDLSLDVAHARARWPRIISTRQVKELRDVQQSGTDLIIGGAVTWDEVLPHLRTNWPSFATLVRRFGSTQIRSMGTVAGNIGTGSPIGDGAPALISLGANLVLAGVKGERIVPLGEFFKGYRELDLEPHEIIKSIIVPLPKKNQQFRVYKISKRYDQDISTVCGAFNLTFDGDRVSSATVAFGGMAATPMRSVSAEVELVGKSLDASSTESVKDAVRQTFTPLDDMRGTANYRLTVAANLIDRLAHDLAGETVEVMAL